MTEQSEIVPGEAYLASGEQGGPSMGAPGAEVSAPVSALRSASAGTPAGPDRAHSRSDARTSRDRVSIGRALQVDTEAAVIVRVLRGEITSVEAASELSVSTNTIRRRVAVFIEGGARRLQVGRELGHSGPATPRPQACTDDAIHAVAEALMERADSDGYRVPAGCADVASHVLGARAIAARRDARVGLLEL